MFGEGVALDPTFVGVLADLAVVVNISVPESKDHPSEKEEWKGNAGNNKLV